MTAMPSFDAFDRADTQAGLIARDRPAAIVTETYWGYIIQSTGRAPTGLVLAQAITWFMAVVFAIASLGLWLMPGASFAGDVVMMKLIASGITAAISAVLFHFASRGTRIEMQIDTVLGEVREVVRNRAGSSTLLGRYGFDSIGAVYLDRGVGTSRLMMTFRHLSETIEIAQGGTAELDRLRHRLGRDLIITNDVRPDHHPQAVPTFAHVT